MVARLMPREIEAKVSSEFTLVDALMEMEELQVILPSKSGHKESDEYNHFWRCSVWERSAINIQKSIKLKQSV